MNKSLCILISLFTVLHIGITPLAKAADTEKQKEIRKLLEASGLAQQLEEMKRQLIAQFSSLTDVPKGFWEAFEKELNMEELVSDIMPIYEKHLSLDEIKAINQFYATPVGKKLLQKQPLLLGEAFAVGKRWGELKSQLAMKRLQQQGIDSPLPTPSFSATVREFSDADLSKLDGKAGHSEYYSVDGHHHLLRCSVYNGSDYQLTEITLRLKVEAGTNSKAIDRLYKVRPKKGQPVPPLSNGSFEAEIGVALEKGQWTWGIEKAAGFK